jgi:hypothetical protein
MTGSLEKVNSNFVGSIIYLMFPDTLKKTKGGITYLRSDNVASSLNKGVSSCQVEIGKLKCC